MYLLDANVFIRAKNLHYGFDICPGFWSWLATSHAGGRVYSIEKIGDELKAGNDALAIWASNTIPQTFFLSGRNPQTTTSLAQASQCASGQTAVAGMPYEQTAIAEFFNGADYFLVAQAHALGYTVVTHETRENSPKRIKIPNACLGMNVRYIDPFALLRAEGVQFVVK